MGQLRLSSKLFLAALLIVVGVLTALTLRTVPSIEPGRVALAVATGCLLVAAAYFPLTFADHTKITLEESFLFASILLFEPGIAILVALLSTLLGDIIRRQPLEEVVFNAAQLALQTGVGALILGSAGWAPNAPRFDQPGILLAIAAAAAAMFLTNTLSVATIIGLESGLSSLRVWSRFWYQSTLSFERTKYLLYLSQLGLGLLAAIVVRVHLWAVVLLLLPAYAVHLSNKQQAQMRERTEQALRTSEVNLAHTQAIARLGSWDWDLTRDAHYWSDELFRLLGYLPRQLAPTLGAYLVAVHPDDRDRVERALRATVHEGAAYNLDHRVVLPDGAVRTLHGEAESVHDGDGKLTRLAGFVQDITERKELEDQLAYRAFHDSLTDLPNRPLFLDRLDHALARASRDGAQLAVLFIDLDGFKSINDRFGHKAGDDVLALVAERLLGCLRPGDTVARLGGDEFAILLEDVADVGEATSIAQRITDTVRLPHPLLGTRTFITASIGIVTSSGGLSSPADLLHDADLAMYRSKQRGKDRHYVSERRSGSSSS